MAAFSYRALNPAGKTIKGVLEGDSERQVRLQLRAQQLKPLAVRSVSEKNRAEASGGRRLFSGSRRLSSKDLSLITRQLASLVQSGLPLDESLQVAARQSRKESIKGMKQDFSIGDASFANCQEVSGSIEKSEIRLFAFYRNLDNGLSFELISVRHKLQKKDL